MYQIQYTPKVNNTTRILSEILDECAELNKAYYLLYRHSLIMGNRDLTLANTQSGIKIAFGNGAKNLYYVRRNNGSLWRANTKQYLGWIKLYDSSIKDNDDFAPYWFIGDKPKRFMKSDAYLDMDADNYTASIRDKLFRKLKSKKNSYNKKVWVFKKKKLGKKRPA